LRPIIIHSGLDAREGKLVRQTVFAALERGAIVVWRNPDTGRYGEVVPEDYFERGGARCRDFNSFVWIEGRKQQSRGTACRNPDGTWAQIM
jgi:surface antigen